MLPDPAAEAPATPSEELVVAERAKARAEAERLERARELSKPHRKHKVNLKITAKMAEKKARQGKNARARKRSLTKPGHTAGHPSPRPNRHRSDKIKKERVEALHGVARQG